MSLAAFDLEIAASLPDGCKDWREFRPLGITCAACQADYLTHPADPLNPYFWVAGDVQYPERRPMIQHEAATLVSGLMGVIGRGYTIVTWNGLSFDFNVLAEESGMYEECVELALNHVDMMFIVVTLRGHYLGLDKAAKGMGIQGKLKQVTLNDGTTLKDMTGGKAPSLWREGQYQAVLDYLADDVRSTLELAQAIESQKYIKWTAQSGNKQKLDIPKLYTVKECLELPEFIPKWGSRLVDREDMMEWIE